MKNSLVFGAMSAILLLGAGCMATETDGGNVTAEPLTQDEAAAQPEVRRVSNDLFTLGVPGSYEVTQSTGQVRIQNFVGQDSPSADYPDDAFYIEFFYGDNVESKANFVKAHSRTEDVIIDDQHFTKGYDRAQGGESWPGTSYLSVALSPTLVIRLSAETPEGLALAEETVAKLQWK